MGAFKTNAMRILDRNGIGYSHFEYDPEITEGTQVARLLGQREERVFKTLVTVSGKGAYYVFIVPVAETLDLKKAAAAVNEKSVSMLKQKQLLPLTGYIHGGCSPVGMKKAFPTVIHKSAESYERIFVSAGQVGHQIEVSPADIASVTHASFADLILNSAG